MNKQGLAEFIAIDPLTRRRAQLICISPNNYPTCYGSIRMADMMVREMIKEVAGRTGIASIGLAWHINGKILRTLKFEIIPCVKNTVLPRDRMSLMNLILNVEPQHD